MSEALAELELADQINYLATASRHNVSHHTLSRHHQGKSTSQEEVSLTVIKVLPDAQESVLVECISALSLRG